MMYALLALGFTMVYGIIELINFAHFSVFMSGTFIGIMVLSLIGVTAVSTSLTGLGLVGVLVYLFVATMLVTGLLGVVIERLCLRPVRHISGTAPMITTIGVAFIIVNIMLLWWGPQAQRFPQLLPNWRWTFGQAEITFKQMVLCLVGLTLMLALNYLVKNTALGKAMRATAQDSDAAKMMGVDVDRVVVLTFFLGSALAGAGSLFFGLYYGFTGYYIGYTTGLRAFTSAVLGGIGNIPGAMLGGLLIGLVQSLGGQLLGVKWTDVIIFSILIVVMVFRPSGLFGMQTPQKA
jgi:branched-chain amino acid transport system permease protein